jgi:1-acyl-sn-glycerol-3-phosphate acyltransferase
VPRVGYAVRILRLLSLVAVLLAGIGVALTIPLLAPAARAAAVRAWFRGVVRASGVQIVVTGHSGLANAVPTLVAANHVSWLDIPAVLAVAPMRVLAKSDVRSWPVIGLLASRGGTIFIDRRRLRRLPTTVSDIATALRGGDSVLVFPEGSTWCGRTQGRIYPATLQSAIDAGVDVRPVSLRYRLTDGVPTTVAAFVGTDTLLASIWRVVSTHGLMVEVGAAQAVPTSGRSRREIAATVAASVRHQPEAAIMLITT